MSTAKLSKPDDYTGEDQDLDPEVLEAWLDTMEDYLVLTKTTDVTEQVSTAAMYLKKTARCWYRTNKATLTTFAILKTKLTAHFIPANYHTQLMLQWDSLKQDKKSVSGFVLEIRSLADKLNKDPESRAHRLMFGINPSFRKFLITQSGGALADGETEFDARKPCSLNRLRKLTALPHLLRQSSLDVSLLFRTRHLPGHVLPLPFRPRPIRTRLGPPPPP